MSTITSHIDHDYCSQMRAPLPHFRTIEEGVKTIEVILAKRVLCQHDAEGISRIYHEVDLLEREVERIPKLNSQYALQKLIEKVEGIAGGINAEGLISLYHLQKCSKMGLPVDQYFANLVSNLGKDPERTKEIATHLPYCSSEAQFNKDIASLIGSNTNEEISSILNRKREELQKRESIKSELEALRKNDPQNYPLYLNELLDNGHLDLCDHLIVMGKLSTREDRRLKIENIPFSLLSQIILQTREAIIQKVEASIPADCRNILFLLGNTKTGKSTTLCFLRGDKMVLKGSHYETEEKSNELIGHMKTKSCTFLPTIEIVNGRVVADFPGFNDTNGPIVTLGIEFALKKLIKKYTPKILVLEAITNNQSGYAEAGKLGSMLTRLLGNKQDCVLGITKYSQDPDFIRMEQQKKEQLALALPTQEEIELLASIQSLSDSHKTISDSHTTFSAIYTKFSNLKLPESEMQNLKSQILNFESQMQGFTSQIQQKQQQLAKIQQEKKQQDEQPLLESRLKIKEKEADLLKEIGLDRFISLSDLENQERLSSCFTTLSEMKAIHANSKHDLHSEHKRLLDNRFGDLEEKIESQESPNEFKDITSFQRSVLESSLIGTILPQSPEAELLHLLEIDPNIVREYDKKIVKDYIEKCISGIICTLKISPMIKALEEVRPKASAAAVKDLEDKLLRLTQYVLGLLGALPPSLDLKKIEEEWRRIQQSQQAKTRKDWYMLPPWVMHLLSIPLKASYHMINSIDTKRKFQMDMANDAIIASCTELDQMFNALWTLKGVEKIIEKQDAIENAFYSVETDMSSEDKLLVSIKNKIQNVKSAYGNDKEWEGRVCVLKEQLILADYHPDLITHILLGAISSLLDDNIQPILCSCSIGGVNANWKWKTDIMLNIIFVKKGMQNLRYTSFVERTYINTSEAVKILARFLEVNKLITREALKEIAPNTKKTNFNEFIKKVGTILLEQAEQEQFRSIYSREFLYRKNSNAQAQARVLFIWHYLKINKYADIAKSADVIKSVEEAQLPDSNTPPSLSNYIRIKSTGNDLAMDLSRPLFRALLADALLQNIQAEKL